MLKGSIIPYINAGSDPPPVQKAVEYARHVCCHKGEDPEYWSGQCAAAASFM